MHPSRNFPCCPDSLQDLSPFQSPSKSFHPPLGAEAFLPSPLRHCGPARPSPPNPWLNSILRLLVIPPPHPKPYSITRLLFQHHPRPFLPSTIPARNKTNHDLLVVYPPLHTTSHNPSPILSPFSLPHHIQFPCRPTVINVNSFYQIPRLPL
jgi:hypothetical protein